MNHTSAKAEEEDPAAVERRIFRNMCVAVVLAVAAGAILWPWRVTVGLALGGALSLVNHHWLRTAIAAAFGASVAGARPKIRIARYVLRYFIVGAAIAAAYALDVVSLPASFLGLSSFAAALMFEGFVQIYFAIVNRGEE